MPTRMWFRLNFYLETPEESYLIRPELSFGFKSPSPSIVRFLSALGHPPFLPEQARVASHYMAASWMVDFLRRGVSLGVHDMLRTEDQIHRLIAK